MSLTFLEDSLLDELLRVRLLPLVGSRLGLTARDVLVLVKHERLNSSFVGDDDAESWRRFFICPLEQGRSGSSKRVLALLSLFSGLLVVVVLAFVLFPLALLVLLLGLSSLLSLVFLNFVQNDPDELVMCDDWGSPRIESSGWIGLVDVASNGADDSAN